MNSSAWNHCNHPTVNPEIVRDRHNALWLVSSYCQRCGVQVFHTKRSNFVFEKRQKKTHPTCYEQAGRLREGTNHVAETTLAISSPLSNLNQVELTRNNYMEGANMRREDVFPSRFIKAADLSGGKKVVKISEVVMEQITDDDDNEKPCCYFEDEKKCLPLNVTNWNSLEEISGSDDSDTWAGLVVQLYVTRVDFQGKRVAAVRIEPAPAAKS